MEISFVAGFGPIGLDAGAASFWRDALGVPLEESGPGYLATEALAGVRHFSVWPLAEAARSMFGAEAWPADLPVPQAWVEFDVASPQAVADAVVELRAAGQRVLTDARDEPWGQTTARLLSPEGLLVGVTYTPWMHPAEAS